MHWWRRTQSGRYGTLYSLCCTHQQYGCTCMKKKKRICFHPSLKVLTTTLITILVCLWANACTPVLLAWSYFELFQSSVNSQGAMKMCYHASLSGKWLMESACPTGKLLAPDYRTRFLLGLSPEHKLERSWHIYLVFFPNPHVHYNSITMLTSALSLPDVL